MGPMGHLDAVLVSVVFDDLEAGFEHLSVQERVQSVASRAEDSGRTLGHTRVLLLGQVICQKSRQYSCVQVRDTYRRIKPVRISCIHALTRSYQRRVCSAGFGDHHSTAIKNNK